MSRSFIFTACFFVMFGAAAHAHPESRILTTGNGARTVMSGDVTIEETNGVHLFKGGPPAQMAELPGDETRMVKKIVKVKVVVRPFRSNRRLRTQGFYSGVPYPSRRYTQGFYSTGR